MGKSDNSWNMVPQIAVTASRNICGMTEMVER